MSYLVEQPPHCDLLRLSLLTRRFVRFRRTRLRIIYQATLASPCRPFVDVRGEAEMLSKFFGCSLVGTSMVPTTVRTGVCKVEQDPRGAHKTKKRSLFFFSLSLRTRCRKLPSWVSVLSVQSIGRSSFKAGSGRVDENVRKKLKSNWMRSLLTSALTGLPTHLACVGRPKCPHFYFLFLFFYFLGGNDRPHKTVTSPRIIHRSLDRVT